MKSFDFTTLYTTIPHDKLKSKLKEIIDPCFLHKNGNRRFKYVVLGYYAKPYFVKDQSDVATKYSETDVIRMLNFFYRQHIRGVRRTDFPANNLYSKGYQLCTIASRTIFVLV